MTAYEETVPQVYVSPPTLPGEYEYLENAKNLSNLSLIDSETKQTVQSEESGKSTADEVVQSSKRPDFLPLSCVSKERKGGESNLESATEPQHYLTRHIAKFEKGYGKPSLGFSVVGGRDSPRGEMGIFVRRVFPGGQADVSKSLFQGRIKLLISFIVWYFSIAINSRYSFLSKYPSYYLYLYRCDEKRIKQSEKCINFEFLKKSLDIQNAFVCSKIVGPLIFSRICLELLYSFYGVSLAAV